MKSEHKVSVDSLFYHLLAVVCLTSCASRVSATDGETQRADAATADASIPGAGGDAAATDAGGLGVSSGSRDVHDSTELGGADASDFDAHVVTGGGGSSSAGSSTAETRTSGSASTSSPPSSGEFDASTSGPSTTENETTTSETSLDAAVPLPSVAADLTDVSQFDVVDCEIQSSVVLAPKIPTVGIATFEADLADAERALIQFGTEAEYTLEAPVEWAEVGHRTLLLGMPAETFVHYRVVVIKGEQACIGPDSVYVTGGQVAGVPMRVAPLVGPSQVEPSPGFIVGTRSDFAYIVNKRGDVVWAYRFGSPLTRATLSWDGKYLLGRDMGPFNAPTGGTIFRVGMDGEGETQLDVAGGSHHDFTTTPEGIAYIAKDEAGDCDSLYTARIDGSESAPLVNLGVVFDKFDLGPQAIAPERCHVNFVRYYDDTQRFSISDREKDAIAYFSKAGVLLGSIGAEPAAATPNHVLAQGADSTINSPWRVQHGHDWYAPNKLVLWSNGVFQGGTSRMLHYTIQGNTAKLDWQYTGTGNSPTLSDAQHLPNGNFLGTNAGTGTVHEIDPTQKLVRSYTGLSRGYPVHRTTLYGPPPGR